MTKEDKNISVTNVDDKSDDNNGELLSLPLIPLRDILVFPFMVIPLFVGRAKSVKALEEAMESDKAIFLTAQKDAKKDEPEREDIYDIGTIANILQLLKLPDGTVKVLVEGKRRGKVEKLVKDEEKYMVSIKESPVFDVNPQEVEAFVRSVKKSFETYVKLNKKIPPEIVSTVINIKDGEKLSDTIATHLTIKLDQKQKILDIFDPVKRLEYLCSLLESEIEILEIESRIQIRVKSQMEKTQREYYLGEQMKAIQRELGEKDEFKSEIDEFDEQLKKVELSEEADKKVKAELKKLKQMVPMSAEATVVRTYLEWVLGLPWQKVSKEKKDIKQALKVLDKDHYGLKKVKDRVIDYLAVRSLAKTLKGPIICLVGPPGVGKTSLAKSIARATGREFVRVSLGGVRDESEIRGHRRTYIGSMPGKIIQSIKKAGTSNPLILLDEIDKMSNDFRGDPASALLEVLDPEQNNAFNDHYLDCDYDLSKVMFLTTANSVQGIPRPLLDRMELIGLSGYTEEEKLHIAKGFLVLKQMKEHGLKPTNMEINDKSLLEIIRRYTREAGVRNLERKIALLCRKGARFVIKNGKRATLNVTLKSITKYLGKPIYKYGEIEKNDEVGTATGLAWTEVGGDTLSVEVALVEGKGKLTITGKLGDVMTESAQAAMTYIRSRAEEFGFEKDFYQKKDVHIHVPEGATPKDGPSAGITMSSAIASAFLNIPVRNDIAMTGEVTLRGKVLPIGGLKEKALAAHRAGIFSIIIPKENEKDLDEIPKNILKKMKFIPVEHMDEVLVNALRINQAKEIFKNPVSKEEIEFLEALNAKRIESEAPSVRH